MQLFLETILNGMQFGVFLFLISAGLTLVFGIMNMVNLAHGSLFMMGAYIGAYVFQQTDSFALAVVAAIPAILLLGVFLEYLALKLLYTRDHLDQVLATFGIILFFNQMVLNVFGATSQRLNLPATIDFPFDLFGITYPFYRLVVIAAGLAVGVGLYFLVAKTRIGMLIRAGASNRAMVGALGVNIGVLFTLVFGLGAALAGLAGVMIGPIESIESGMGENKLILAFVVIVIGGIGSIRGAFVASILIGLVEVFGRTFLKGILANWSLATILIGMIGIGAVIVLTIGNGRLVRTLAVAGGLAAFVFLLSRTVLTGAFGGSLPGDFAQTAGPALASMSIYILMAAVLAFRPQGLFPARTG
jgi:branched-chain amino acid transport system permease protein